MRTLYSVLVTLTLSCSAQVWAQAPQCDAIEGKVVASLGELPAKVQDILGRAKTGVSGIADIGGEFNPSDAIVDRSVPMRRLVSGAMGRSCIWLTIEYGGIGHYQKKLEYRLGDHGWTQVKDATSGRAPFRAPPVTTP